MKIHFIAKFSDGHKSFDVGPHYEVENVDAARYIDAGIARKSIEPIEEPKLPEAERPHPLKDHEQVGNAADTKLPDAKPVKPAKDTAMPVVPPAPVVVTTAKAEHK